MGIEHFYWFVDREVIDPVLEMTWKAFLRKYPWERDSLDDVLTFAVEGEPDSAAITHILDNHTLRWTMKRSSPAYWVLNEIVHHVPTIKLRCPEVWIYNDFDLAILEAAAVNGFLIGRISERTLWAVYNIDGQRDPSRWLELPDRNLSASKLRSTAVPWRSQFFPGCPTIA